MRRDVWRHLRFLGADVALAEDLAQEAFVALLEWPPEERGIPALSAWLRATARNLFRRSGRAPRAEVVLAEDALLEAAWVRLQGPDEGASRRAALEQCTAALDAESRRLLELRYAKALSRTELAATLDTSEEGVKSRLRRIKDQLRACVARRLNHD